MVNEPSDNRDDSFPEADASSGDSTHLDQDAIDEMLRSANGSEVSPSASLPSARDALLHSDAPAIDDNEVLDQETLDLLFAAQAESEPSSMLNQADIDSLLQVQETATPAESIFETMRASAPRVGNDSDNAGTLTSGSVNQDDIDALFAAGPAALPDEPPGVPEDPVLVARAERMMAMSAAPADLPPVIAQAELDQLLAEADRERAEELAAHTQEREAAKAAENAAIVNADPEDHLAPALAIEEADEASAIHRQSPQEVLIAAEEPPYPALAASAGPPDIPSEIEDSFSEEEEEVSDEVLAALMAAAGDEPLDAAATHSFSESVPPPVAPTILESPPAAHAPEPVADEDVATFEAASYWQRRKALAAGQRLLSEHFARLTASIAAGLLAGVSAFAGLYIYQERVPEFAVLKELSPTNELESSAVHARALLSQGDASGAASLLEGPIQRAPLSPALQNAQILRLEAMYNSLGLQPAPPEGEAFLGEADRVLSTAQTHPRAAEILYWQAKVYERLGMRQAAKDTYGRAIDLYGDAAALDQILIEAARLELALRATSDATEHARRLLQQFPGSPHADDARFLLADAYNQANLVDEAQAIYARIAESESGNALGAEAYLRLAELALEQGDAASAIDLLEQRLASSMTTAGNDRVYVMLGQAQQVAGDYEAAITTLNDVVTFFPDSPVLPRAYVQLSQAYEAQGRRDEALRIARQAAARYPDSVPVLTNAGELFGLSGNAQMAAEALMAADAAGANDPQLLLTAARHFKTTGALKDARGAYDLLRLHYPRSPQAILASIEEAAVMYGQGQITTAVDRLENLLLTLKGQPQHLLALRTLSGMYEDLGLTARVQELAREAAGISTEPEVLAETASTLLRTGNIEEGQAVAQRLTLSAVNDQTAYQLMVAQGKALLAADPQRGVDTLEQAYLRYPQMRTAAGDQALLEAYIGTNRRAAARRMVTEIQAEAMTDPVETPRLLQAAVSWGDALYKAGDHRGAAEAYGMAATLDLNDKLMSAGQMRDVHWARYQRANMLLESSDYQEAFRMYQEIASSDAPWAQEAATKAGYTRMQLRLRGLPVPAEDAQG